MKSKKWVLILSILSSIPTWAVSPPIEAPSQPISIGEAREYIHLTEAKLKEFNERWDNLLKPYNDRINQKKAEAEITKTQCNADFDCVKKVAKDLRSTLDAIKGEMDSASRGKSDELEQIKKETSLVLEKAHAYALLGELDRQLRATKGTTLESKIKVRVFTNAQCLESFFNEETPNWTHFSIDKLFANNNEVLVFQFLISDQGQPPKQVTGILSTGNKNSTGYSDLSFYNDRYDYFKKVIGSTAPFLEIIYSSQLADRILSNPYDFKGYCNFDTSYSDYAVKAGTSSYCGINVDVQQF